MLLFSYTVKNSINILKFTKNGGIKMFEISKYKKSNVKLSIRLPEKMNETLRKIAKKDNMSFNNVIVSCIQNSLDQMDLEHYKKANIISNICFFCFTYI